MTERDEIKPETAPDGDRTGPTGTEPEGSQPTGSEPTGCGGSPDEQTVTSPTLDHLAETIKSAQQASDAALAPQRE